MVFRVTWNQQAPSGRDVAAMGLIVLRTRNHQCNEDSPFFGWTGVHRVG